tara:strand:- start:516 stop:731 length:216 start_codon:yes stop_codon:yes gene_type:complete
MGLSELLDIQLQLSTSAGRRKKSVLSLSNEYNLPVELILLIGDTTPTKSFQIGARYTTETFQQFKHGEFLK